MDRVYAPWRSEYLMSAAKSSCLFCDLADANEDRRNLVLERGERWYVMINRYPYTTGHLMIVARRHVERFSALTVEENAELMTLMARCEQAVEDAYGPDGINVGANLGRSAGAGIIGHLHVHVVPRWQGDTNFMSSVGETRVVSEDLMDTYDRIQGALAAL